MVVAERAESISLPSSPSVLARPLSLTVIALLAALAIALPVLAVLQNLLVSASDTWSHLARTVLGEYIVNSALLMLGVAAGVTFGGVLSAWITTMCRFPGRRVFEWALLLPMAMPAYVMAYAYTDLLQFAGPVQSALREWMGWHSGLGQYWFPDIRSLGGAVCMFSLVLYPYVYLLARAAFLEQSDSMLEMARVSGYGPWGTFRRVALPLARPGIVAGVALALMETLADFGTVTYFGVPTFTTGIFRAWFSLGDHAAAAQLSAALLGFVFLILLLERLSRARAGFHNSSHRKALRNVYPLGGVRALAAFVFCAVPVAFGFLLPLGVMLHMALTSGDAQFGARYVQLTFNTVTLASITAVLAVLLALAAGYAARSSSGLVRVANRIASMGYAVPGAVIAVGVLIPITRLDHVLGALIESFTGAHPGLLLTGGVAALVYAYLVRFFAVSLQTVEAGLSKITLNMDSAARSLGCGPAATLARVHAPLLWRSALTAGLLVWVDVMKELPATFVMRPFNFDTLAVQAYNLASDERLAEASTAVVTIVAVGLIPLIVLARMILDPQRRDGRST